MSYQLVQKENSMVIVTLESLWTKNGSAAHGVKATGNPALARPSAATPPRHYELHHLQPEFSLRAIAATSFPASQRNGGW